MPGIFPTRLTTILSLLFPVRTFTALLMVMLSRLTPFTSISLSPTVRPASVALLFLQHVAHGALGSPTLASIAEVGVPTSICHLAPGRMVK
uniref:Uncharacterized protein n=1 Tax=Poecilia mexicana TaxID=48701 RepID=A0A3B3XI25_9TELE